LFTLDKNIHSQNNKHRFYKNPRAVPAVSLTSPYSAVSVGPVFSQAQIPKNYITIINTIIQGLTEEQKI
jgi:hypothetical protein